MGVKQGSLLWDYLSDELKDLILQGEHLLQHVHEHKDVNFEDYSFLVFPFAKAYEGFLKKILLDAGFISKTDYNSDHFRLGKVLSPNLVQRLGKHSVYKKICDAAGCELSDQIWKAWKSGRNQVFHYFPKNVRSLTIEEAEDLIGQIIRTMEDVVKKLKVEDIMARLKSYA